MYTLYVSYLVVFSATGIICLVGLLGVRTLDHPDVRRGLGGLLVLSGTWALLTALQLLASSLVVKRAIYMVALVAGIGTIFAWLHFASAYSGRQYHRNPYLRSVAVAIFVAIVLVKLTNPLHGAYFEAQLATKPFRHAELVHFSPHWFVTGFSYTAAGWGFWLLYDSFQDAESRPTLLYLLVAVTALPLIPYVVSPYTDLLLHINYEPLGVAVFAIGVLFYARGDFMRLSSPDQSYIADSISEGALVVDDEEAVINYNENVASMLGDRPAYRSSLADLDGDLADLGVGETAVVTRAADGYQQTYEAERTELDAPMAKAAITLTDVSTVAHLEEVTRLYRELSNALVDGADPEELERTIPEKLAEIDAYRFVRLVSVDGEQAEHVGGEPGGYPDDVGTEPEEPITRAAETGQRALVDVDTTTADWAREAADREITACLAVPVAFPDGTTRVLAVYTIHPEGFGTAEIALIQEIAESIPHALSAIRAHKEATEYQKAVEHAGYAIFVTDTDGTIRHVNPAFEEITGYSAAEAIGETPRILKSGEADDDYYDRLWKTILDGDLFEEEIINKTRSGDRYLARQTIAPVTDEAGDPIAFVAIQVDITDQLLREQRLTVLNRILRHNIRNEMNLISGHAELVEDVLESLPETVDRRELAIESAREIQDVAEGMVTRTEKVREIEKTLDRLRGSRTSISVDDVVQSIRPRLETLDIEGEVTVSDDVSAYRVDREVEMIIDELVENAVTHTDSSDPTLEVTVAASDGDDLRFSVSDDGPGLSEQELAIFDDGVETPLRHGSGLGLWMVNWLAVYCGGSVSASVDSQGSTIDVLVPAQTTDSADETADDIGLEHPNV